MPQSLTEIEIFSSFETRNLPSWGCKSMVESVRNMLRMLLTLLYI